MNPANGNRRLIALAAAIIFAVLTPQGDVLGADTPPSGKPGRILLSGGSDVLWVARGGEGKQADTFDLIIRRPGGKWKTLPRFSGNPAAMAAGNMLLHIVSGGATPNTSVFSLSQSDAGIFLRGNGPRPGGKWPVSDPPSAICSTPPLGKSTSPGFIAAVAHESDKLSATTATSQPSQKRSGLTILQTVEGQWVKLSEINNVPGAVGARISLAATDNWIYVLAVSEDDTARMFAWSTTDKNAVWKTVALPDKPQSPLSVSVLRNQPVLITIAPIGWTTASPTTLPEAGGVKLAIHEIKADKIANNPQSIEYQGEPLALPGSSIPHVCSLGQASESQLVLLWKKTDSYRYALVDLNGEVVENKEVSELLKIAPSLDSGKVLDYFPLVILGMVLVVILIGRKDRPTGPMILPARFVPGALPKRFAAIAIDYTPIIAIAMTVFVKLRPDLPLEDISPLMLEQQNLPVELVVCMLSSLVTWIIYGSIMEIVFGATLGKMVMKLEVMSADGTKPTTRQLILRNLIRPIEMSLLIILFTIAATLLTQTHQRLGDLMARTVVVEKTRSPKPDDPQRSLD